MIVTLGGRFGGYGLYLQKGKPVFVYNLLDLERSLGRRRTGEDSSAGRSSRASIQLVFDFKYDGPAPARAAPACSR